MKNSAVQGNVRLKGQAVMANDSMLIGDLSSQVAQLNGKIKGNIEISGKIMLDRDSVIIGDIKAGSIAISDGAVINGFVTTTYLQRMKVPTFPRKYRTRRLSIKILKPALRGFYLTLSEKEVLQ